VELFDGTQIEKMRQQEHHQQLSEMDNNDRKRDETTSLDASTVQHKAPVKGRINNDPLTLPHNDLNLKVLFNLIHFFIFLIIVAAFVSWFWWPSFQHSFVISPVCVCVYKVMTLQTV
jgi:hypothetical protein